MIKRIPGHRDEALMGAHIIDSAFFADLFGSSAMRSVFSERALLQKWLDYEAALARAEAAAGLIPCGAAAEITCQARAERFDLDAIKRGIDRTLHPLVPVIRQLSRLCRGEAGRYVHWGATTQDVMDTALILQIKDALAIVSGARAQLQGILAGLAKTHRDTPMAGRTHGQQALPTTFGFKVAVWLAELRRHDQRLAQARERALVGQFAGGVGSLAGLCASGVDALAVQSRLMQELGLAAPLIAWHTSRDGIVEVINALCMITALLGRIAREIILLQKQEIAELEEPFEAGQVGSSTMPQKRNPMLCESILTLARLCREKPASALDTLIENQHERDWTAFQMEWAFVPEVFIMTHGALEMSCRVLRGLRVNSQRMLRNLGATGGLLLSERVMFALSPRYGRQKAHDLVYRCAMSAHERDQPFIELLLDDAEVSAALSRAELETLLDPRHYTGLADHFVDRVLASLD